MKGIKEIIITKISLYTILNFLFLNLLMPLVAYTLPSVLPVGLKKKKNRKNWNYFWFYSLNSDSVKLTCIWTRKQFSGDLGQQFRCLKLIYCFKWDTNEKGYTKWILVIRYKTTEFSKSNFLSQSNQQV